LQVQPKNDDHGLFLFDSLTFSPGPPLEGPENFDQNAILALGLTARRVSRESLKGIECRIDRGFMPPKASNKARFRKLSFAI
jgi:hypothetical protein